MALHIILGCMFSGKTTTLMKELNRYKIASVPTMLINHSFDAARTEGKAVLRTHENISTPAYMASDLSQVLKLPDYKEVRVIGIDEGQFFTDLMESVLKMISDGKIVYVAGLDGTFTRKPFGQILQLIPYCDTVRKLTAVCTLCPTLENAIFTKVLDNRQLNEINIGGSDKYTAVCRKHF